MPSACGAFTSACCLRSVRIAARFCFSTASANGDLAPAAGLEAAISIANPTGPNRFILVVIFLRFLLNRQLVLYRVRPRNQLAIGPGLYQAPSSPCDERLG